MQEALPAPQVPSEVAETRFDLRSPSLQAPAFSFPHTGTFFMTHLGHTAGVEKVFKGALNTGLGVTPTSSTSQLSELEGITFRFCAAFLSSVEDDGNTRSP